MEKYERQQIQTLLKRLGERPRFLQIIQGPRQSGKTTLVQQTLAQVSKPHAFIPLDRPGARSQLSEEVKDPSDLFTITKPEHLVTVWQKAREYADQSDEGFVLALDEIHLLLNWSSTVKGLWDQDRLENRNLHVILLGSAPLGIQAGLSESLTGRFEVIRLPHWSYIEMRHAFNIRLDEYIYFGGYPSAAEFITDEDRWRDYVRSALIEPTKNKDVLSLVQISDSALFQKLFDLALLYPGQILSYNKILGQLQDAGNTTTLAGYLNLLERAELIAGLEKCSLKPIRTKSSSPKLIAFNNALVTANSDYTYRSALADRSFWGRLVENSVGAHCLNSSSAHTRVEYWRMSNHEVDFVVSNQLGSVAIEVKSGTKRPRTKGLDEFSERFNPTRVLLVGEHGVPIEEFLSNPIENWLSN